MCTMRVSTALSSKEAWKLWCTPRPETSELALGLLTPPTAEGLHGGYSQVMQQKGGRGLLVSEADGVVYVQVWEELVQPILPQRRNTVSPKDKAL